MKTRDVLSFAFHSIERAPTRTALMLLAMAIGVAAVVLLTGLGEAARRFVLDEFASLGTNLVSVLPGKSETTGGTLGASFDGTTRDLTIDDAVAITRHHLVAGVAPIIVGAAGVQHAGLEREVPIIGATSQMLSIRHWRMAQGQVGVLKALGAAPSQIVVLFLTEAGLLSIFGALIGVGVGLAGSWILSQFYPALNMAPPVWPIVAGAGVAIITGLVFGIMPARRAAGLDPVLALARR